MCPSKSRSVVWDWSEEPGRLELASGVIVGLIVDVSFWN